VSIRKRIDLEVVSQIEVSESQVAFPGFDDLFSQVAGFEQLTRCCEAGSELVARVTEYIRGHEGLESVLDSPGFQSESDRGVAGGRAYAGC